MIVTGGAGFAGLSINISMHAGLSRLCAASYTSAMTRLEGGLADYRAERSLPCPYR